MDKLFRFPAKANKQQLLAQSKLLVEDRYVKPDSVMFLDKLKAEVKGREGWVYFFKYKKRKDDATWRIASVGLVPMDSTKFEWQPGLADTEEDEEERWSHADKFDFTGFSSIKIRDDEAVATQLQKQLKRMLYSKRKSAQEFYDRDSADYEDVMVNVEEGDN
jgi:hypothetical protein